MKIIYTAIAIATASACAAGAVRLVPIDYRVVDSPETQSLQLIYKNSSTKKVCIGAENWPSKGGIIDNSGDEFYVTVNDKQYFLKLEQDYCPTCETKIKPGQTIESKLNYSSFDLPADLYNSPKTLHLKSTGYIC